MPTQILALLLALVLSLPFGPAHAAPELSAEQAARDLRILRRAFTDLHAGLYRQASPAQIDAEFERAQAAVAQGASRTEMFLHATRIAAAVRCGHTWTNVYNQSDALQAEFAGRANKLPLRLRFVAGRALVTASAVPAIAPGTELLAINDRSPTDIQAALLPYLRADADGDGKRLAQLNDDANGGAMQWLFPLLFPPESGRWRLRLPGGAELSVAAVASVPGTLPPVDWQLRIEGDRAVMTLPTFAFWNRPFDGNAWLTDAFQRLASQRVSQLVIDLRDNEGGDDSLGLAVLAHLISQPFTQPGGRRESAYERAPYELARFLDTWDFSFFDRTGQVQKTEGRNWRMADALPMRVEPKAPRFTGRVAALIGPQNSSAGFLLARNLKASGAALLIGQRTAGNLQGLNGGQIAWVRLPHSGVSVDIPLVANFTAGNPPSGGVQPDLNVTPDFAAAARGEDVDMVRARAWLAEGR